jgi:hypothetical protein
MSLYFLTYTLLPLIGYENVVSLLYKRVESSTSQEREIVLLRERFKSDSLTHH